MRKGLLAFLAMVKQIANIANGLSAVWSAHPDRPRTRHALPGMDRYADQIGQSFCLLDRFLQLAFCWRSPPPGPTAWPVRAGGSTRNFFLLASLYTKVLECLTLAL